LSIDYGKKMGAMGAIVAAYDMSYQIAMRLWKFWSWHFARASPGPCTPLQPISAKQDKPLIN
jgi:hypothetical protein